MLEIASEMYVSLMPAILAGIFNMLFCKLPVLGRIQTPIDGGRSLPDGKRIFGENKTWKGMLGMVALGCAFGVLWGFLCGCTDVLGSRNYLYARYPNTLPYNALMGALIGLAYALFELPNSFLKRRLDITPGKTCKGFKKIFFILLDQADSIFGCVLVISAVYGMTPLFYFAYVLLGAATHLLLNMLLYFAKLRKNIF